MKPVKVWFLHHSSFAVQIEKCFLIFDYYNNQPLPGLSGLVGGVVDPVALKGMDVYVFSSHRHHDHYDPLVLKWREQIPGITYIFSSDVPAKIASDIHFLHPNMDTRIKDLHIRTLRSNDEGIAFHVEVEGVNLFHSGDLNWWRWEGESDEWIAGMEKTYFDEMAQLKHLPVDIAFIPVDPRLEKNYALSVDYYAKKIHPESIIFPMHFNESWHYGDWLQRDGYVEEMQVQIIHNRGEMFTF